LFYSTSISDKEKSTIPRLLPIARPIICFQESKRIACAVITNIVSRPFKKLMMILSGSSYSCKPFHIALGSWYMIHVLSCMSHCGTDRWITYHAFSHRVNKWNIENKAILNSKDKIFSVYYKGVDTGCFSHIL